MRERKDPNPPDADQPAEEQLQKQIEKIKADNEKFIKSEMEKLVKPELKESKIEIKEHKLEKFEIKEHKLEKPEAKEQKFEKELKHEKFEHKEFKVESKELKHEKLEIKEQKPELEKAQVEGFASPESSLPIDRESLRQHADALEETARQLRHFIEQSERPDLSRGALKDEPEQGGDDR
jgi:hypothetical protein